MEEILRLFCTRLRFVERNGVVTRVWRPDSKLQNNIERFRPNLDGQQDPEEYLARFFLTHPDTYAQLHLIAYLEKFADRAARSVYRQLRDRIPSLPKNDLQQQLQAINKVEMLVSFGLEETANPDEYLRNFQFGPENLVRKYAYSTAKGQIKDRIFVGSLAILRRSPYWLLSHTTERRMTTALEKAGYREPSISCYLLAFEGFKDRYVPTQTPQGLRYLPPTTQQLANIVIFWNDNRNNLPANVANVQVNQDQIQNWLEKICIPALYSLDSPPVSSLNTQNSDDEEVEQEIRDDRTPAPMDQLENQELIDVVQEFIDWLNRNKNRTKKIFLLMHGFGLEHQQSIADLLGVDRVTVYRDRKNAQKQLIKKLQQHFQYDNVDDLQEAGVRANIYMAQYYRELSKNTDDEDVATIRKLIEANPIDRLRGDDDDETIAEEDTDN